MPCVAVKGVMGFNEKILTEKINACMSVFGADEQADL